MTILENRGKGGTLLKGGNGKKVKGIFLLFSEKLVLYEA